MQSFNSYRLVLSPSDFTFSNMDLKISISLSARFCGTPLPNEALGLSYDISSTNVSSHIFEVLCFRFVIVIQYEKSILYTYDTFSWIQPSLSWSPVHQVASFRLWFLNQLLWIFQIILFGLTSNKYVLNHILRKSVSTLILSDFLLFWMTVQLFFTVVYVSGLSCRKLDSYHCLILMVVILFSQWTHPNLSLDFIPFM